MPQIFHPAMNTLARVTIFGAVLIVTGLFAMIFAFVRSPYMTEAGVVREQPVPFSHRHHVADVGLDCRYCHTSVETSSFAGMPSTSICMHCHSQLFTESAMLQPVRDSYKSGEPLRWTRVHDLPDFVYFDHSIHVHKGVACQSCHGDVAQMPLMWREHSLAMQWCLDCHRHPEERIGSREDVFLTSSQKKQPSAKTAREYSAEYAVKSETSCYTCHR